MTVAGIKTAGPTRRKRETNILVIDIERRPGMAYAWQPRVDYLPPSMWIRWPSLLCFAAKWHGRRAVTFDATWLGDTMLQTAWDLLDRADIVVGYNTIRFDNKHLRSEFLAAGMPLPSPWKDVDLFAEVRRSLGFESKSLDQVAKRLGLKGKTDHYDMALGELAAEGDEAAQRRLRRYNIGDVLATERVYDRLTGWLPNHPSMGLRTDDTTVTCNQCGSDDLERNGEYRADQLVYPRYRCANCGANVRGVRSIKRTANTKGIR